MPCFQYSDSIGGDQIRVLTLRPSINADSLVECQLTTYSRDDCDPYEALSYCWGPPDSPKRDIFVNDLPCQVRESLASALYHLRLPDKERYLWVDALCINQASKPEKSVQVGRMDETYRKCYRAPVWLGPASEDEQSRLGMRAIAKIGEPFVGVSMIDVSLSRRPLPPEIDECDIDQYLLAVRRLLEREWFSRLWVFQEVCLAPRVDLVCGGDVVPITHLTNLQLSLPFSPDLQMTPELPALDPSSQRMKRYELVQLFDAWLYSTRQLFQVTREEVPDIDELKSKNCNLLTLLWHCRRRRCENPRDRVYAVMKLSLDVSHELAPDYEDSVANTFTKTTRAIMKQHKNLDVLFLCCGHGVATAQESWTALEPSTASEVSTTKEASSVPQEPFPSWVPNYNADPDTKHNMWTLSPLTNYLPGSKRYFTATDASKFHLESSDPLGKLTTHGYDIGAIDQFSGLGLLDGGIQNARRLVEAKLASKGVAQVQGIFWRTIISNRRSDSTAAEGDIEGKEFDDWWYWVNHSNEKAFPELAKYGNYNAAYWQHGYQRCLFSAGTELIGLARSMIKDGDHVVLLAGGQTPFILRPCEDKWQVVCEAYVHGIMEGTLWNELGAGKAPRSKFVLV